MFQLLPKIHPLFPMFSALSLPCLPPLFLREDNIAQGAIKINLLVDKLLKQMGRALGTSIPSLETAESTLYEKVLAQLRGLSDAQLKLVSEYIGSLTGLPSPVLPEETPTTQCITLPVSEKFTS